MATRFYALNSPNHDSPVIDVTFDGDHYTDDMSADYHTCVVYLAFYNDKELTDQVTPTAGTVKVTGSPVGETYLEPSNGNGVINAKDVGIPFGAYTPPLFLMMIERIKVDVAGVAGAKYMTATVWRR